MDSFKSKWIHGSPVFSLIKLYISLTALSRTYSDLLHNTCCVRGNHRDREAQERLNLIKIQHLWEKIKQNHTLYARERHFWHISPVLQRTNPSAESTGCVMRQVQDTACPPPFFFLQSVPFCTTVLQTRLYWDVFLCWWGLPMDRCLTPSGTGVKNIGRALWNLNAQK